MLGFSERIYLWGWVLLWGEFLFGWRLLLLIFFRFLGWEFYVFYRGFRWGRFMRGRILVLVFFLVLIFIYFMWGFYYVLFMIFTIFIVFLFIISVVFWFGSFIFYLRLKRIIMRFKIILFDEVKMGFKIWLFVFNFKSIKFVLIYVSKINF